MIHSTPHLLPSDSLPRFPMDDDSLPSFGGDWRDDDDMAQTLEVRPRQITSPDVLCEIGVRASEVSSRPVWNIREAFPRRLQMTTVSIRERHPTLVRLLAPVLASVLAFTLTLAIAFLCRGSLASTIGVMIR